MNNERLGSDRRRKMIRPSVLRWCSDDGLGFDMAWDAQKKGTYGKWRFSHCLCDATEIN